MRVSNTILLSTLLVTGLSVNLKDAGAKDAFKLQNSDFLQTHLAAEESEGNKDNRGSGRKTPYQVDIDSSDAFKVAAENSEEGKDNRGSGRRDVQSNINLPQLNNGGNSDGIQQHLVAQKPSQGTYNRGSGRKTPGAANNIFKQIDSENRYAFKLQNSGYIVVAEESEDSANRGSGRKTPQNA